jgi:hypothetical protein
MALQIQRSYKGGFLVVVSVPRRKHDDVCVVTVFFSFYIMHEFYSLRLYIQHGRLAHIIDHLTCMHCIRRRSVTKSLCSGIVF